MECNNLNCDGCIHIDLYRYECNIVVSECFEFCGCVNSSNFGRVIVDGMQCDCYEKEEL